MSRINNNKHYASRHAYHTIRLNRRNSSKNEDNVIINVYRDATALYGNTHLASVIISPLVPESKIVEHEVARMGSFQHHHMNHRPNSNIKVNGTSLHPHRSYLTIYTTQHVRDIYSSKLTTASANNAGGGDSGGGSSVTQYWS